MNSERRVKYHLLLSDSKKVHSNKFQQTGELTPLMLTVVNSPQATSIQNAAEIVGYIFPQCHFISILYGPRNLLQTLVSVGVAITSGCWKRTLGIATCALKLQIWSNCSIWFKLC